MQSAAPLITNITCLVLGGAADCVGRTDSYQVPKAQSLSQRRMNDSRHIWHGDVYLHIPAHSPEYVILFSWLIYDMYLLYLFLPYLSQVIRRFVVFVCFIYVEAGLNCTSVADPGPPFEGERGWQSVPSAHQTASGYAFTMGARIFGGMAPPSPHLDPPLQPMMTSLCYSA